MNEEILYGGSVNQVTRVGDTVRRGTGPWTPAVHALLDHLAGAGFRYSPQVHGIDARGREVLSYIAGTPASRPWPAVMLGDDGLRQLGRMLRELSEAVADFTPPPDAVWRTRVSHPDLPPPPDGPVRHGDIGPWNTIWDGDRLIGVIDWDFAEPSPPLWDLAKAAWFCVPMRGGDTGWRICGVTSEPSLRDRLRVLCDAYGARVGDVLDATVAMRDLELRRIAVLGREGAEPFATFLNRGDVAELEAEAAWLAERREGLV